MFGFNETSEFLIYFFLGVFVFFYGRLFYINRNIFKFALHNYGLFLPILPMVGTTYVTFLAGKKRNMLSMAQWFRKYIGSPLNLWIGHTYYYICGNADELKIILNHPKCLNKSTLYNDAQNIFGKRSLAFVHHEEWKGRRRHFSKSFKPSILKRFMNTFNIYSYKLVEDIKEMNGKVVSVNCMNSYVFNTLCVTSFGLDHQKFGKELAEFGHLREKIEEALAEKVLNPMLPFSWWTNLYANGRKTEKYMKRCKVILEKIIREKKMKLEENHDYIENSNEVLLLDLILCYNNEILSDEEIFEEMCLFASAGTESSSLVLHLGFTLLGMYPDIQEKMFMEVTNQIGDNAITSQNIGNLKYIEAVIFEVMRLMPVVPFVARKTSADIDLGNNKVIPKGVDVVIDVFHLQREEMYWKNPNKFDPTRFLPQNADKIVPYSYMPFSSGPRDCIGKHQGMALLKITYANIVRNFKSVTKHKSIDELELGSAVTLYSSNPVDLRFIPR